MISGRHAVSRGWSRLSDDVRSGPLSNAEGSAPNRRAFKPLVRRLFPDYKASVLASAGNSIQEHYDPEVIVERIAGADHWLRLVGHLLLEVKAQLGARRVAANSDPLFTLTIAEAPAPDDHTAGDPLAQLALSICDRLAGDESRSITALKRLFDDPVQHERMVQELEAAWVSRHVGPPSSGEAIAYSAHLDAYLAALVFDQTGKAAITKATGEDAWWLAVAVDAPNALLRDPGSAGLSSNREPVRPLLIGGGTGAPLDQSIYQRLWSVLKGAAGREWLGDLPELPAMASLEIEASAHPLGVRTAVARAGLSAGARAYTAITPDEPNQLLFDEPGAVGYLNRKVARFLASVGGFAELHSIAQDKLWNAERALIPGLWTKLHNGEYRPQVLTSPTWVWAQVAGEVETLLRDIKEDHVKSRVGVSSGAWPPAVQPDTRRRLLGPAVGGDRDERVRASLSHARNTLGSKALEDILKIRDREAQEAWEEAVGGLAAWDDLLGFLDDHLPRD